MKKKIYFIVSSVIQIFISIYLIINANEVFKNTMDSLQEAFLAFPSEMQERINNIMNSSGVYYVIVPAAIAIIVNIIILIIASTNKIKENNGLLIFLIIMCFMTSNSSISTLLAIANIIILFAVKDSVKEDNNEIEKKGENKKKDYKEIVVNSKEKKYSKKEIIFAAIIFIAYFSQVLLDFVVPEMNKLVAGFISISFYVIMFLLAFFLFGDKIIGDFKNLTKNFGLYVKYDLPKVGLMFVSMAGANILRMIITNNVSSVNQDAVESLPKLIMFILAVLWAPVVEEVVFRGTIRRFIKNNILFIIISAVLFGSMHAINEANIINIIFTTLPYAAIGGWLAYIYYKTDNIANNIMIHAIWNFFMVILSFLVGMII